MRDVADVSMSIRAFVVFGQTTTPSSLPRRTGFGAFVSRQSGASNADMTEQWSNEQGGSRATGGLCPGGKASWREQIRVVSRRQTRCGVPRSPSGLCPYFGGVSLSFFSFSRTLPTVNFCPISIVCRHFLTGRVFHPSFPSNRIYISHVLLARDRARRQVVGRGLQLSGDARHRYKREPAPPSSPSNKPPACLSPCPVCATVALQDAM